MSATDVGAVDAPTIRRSAIMQAITTIGLDIAKSVFQVHGIDAEGKVIIRRQLKRRYVLAFFEKLPPCLPVSTCTAPMLNRTAPEFNRSKSISSLSVSLSGAVS